MRRLAWTLALLAPGISGCWGDAAPPAVNPPSGVSPTAGESSTKTSSSASSMPLAGDDLKGFFHLSEGSEIYPLAWLKALENSETSKPFLSDTARFGLIPDPEDPDGLPIGMTSDTSRGAESLGKMVGINCAGCHVGQITKDGKSALLIGGPALFDLNKFYFELFNSAEVMLKDPTRRRAFFGRVAAAAGGEIDAKTKLLFQTLSSMADSGAETLGDQAKSFDQRLKSLMDKIAQHSTEPRFGADLPGLKAAISRDFQADFDAIARDFNPASIVDGPFADLRQLGDPGSLRKAVEDLAVNVALLQARVLFLKELKDLHTRSETTIPGPGRIDAFVNIRDLVFPDDAIDPSSPVSYPFLWDFPRTTWLHWDGNTNSITQRNVGQALGLGAVHDPKTQASTINILHLRTLEDDIGRLVPPVWPTILPPIDLAKADRGAKIYSALCISCHKDPSTPRGPDRETLVPIAEVGTDPNRSTNFARPLKTGPFPAALKAEANALEVRAIADAGLSPAVAATIDLPLSEIVWRATGAYVARPLVAIWGTAPYLHNGSVPSIAELLKPAADRIKSFPIGHREYDPVNLGYVSDLAKIPADQKPFAWTYDTSVTGNRNVGHEGPSYGTDLSDSDKADLIEFLKTGGSTRQATPASGGKS